MLSLSLLSYSLIDLISLVIVIIGILVQARIGIGFALLCAPILFIIDENYMPGPILILGFSLSLLVFIIEKQPLSLRIVLPALVARFPGSWCGVLVLAYLPQWLLGMLIATSLLCASGLSLFNMNVPLSKRNLFYGGFFSGFSGTITSIGGPVMALIYQNQAPAVTRQALITFFLIGTPISIALLMIAGEISPESYALSLKMLPGVLIGYALSRYRLFSLILPTKKSIVFLSAFSAMIIFVKSLLLLL